jgi:hypothetical protein
MPINKNIIIKEGDIRIKILILIRYFGTRYEYHDLRKYKDGWRLIGHYIYGNPVR